MLAREVLYWLASSMVTFGGAAITTVGTLKAFTARAAIGVGVGQGVVEGCRGSLGRSQQMNLPFG